MEPIRGGRVLRREIWDCECMSGVMCVAKGFLFLPGGPGWNLNMTGADLQLGNWRGKEQFLPRK